MLKEPLNHLLHPRQGRRDCPPEVAGMEMLLLWGFHGDPLGTAPCQWRELCEISAFCFSLVQPNHPPFPRGVSTLQVHFFSPSAFPAVYPGPCRSVLIWKGFFRAFGSWQTPGQDKRQEQQLNDWAGCKQREKASKDDCPGSGIPLEHITQFHVSTPARLHPPEAQHHLSQSVQELEAGIVSFPVGQQRCLCICFPTGSSCH